jgi:hypothetical protein
VLGLGELELVLGELVLVLVPVLGLGLALQEVTEIGDAEGDRDVKGEPGRDVKGERDAAGD